ncbi:DNA-directed RNA polymerases I [Conglomerata obtusa]
MATELLSDRFTIQTVDQSDQRYAIIRKIDMSSSNASITLDIHSQLIDLNPSNSVDVLLYHGIVDDNDVPVEYNYLVVGRMYEMKNDGDKIVYYGSFGGMQFVLKSINNVAMLDDRCDVSLAIRKY